MSKKSQRNAGRERKTKVIEAEAKLKKMRYYWIFSAVWFLMGAFLTAVGANAVDSKVDAAGAFKVGLMIVVLAVGFAIYGIKLQHNLRKKLEQVTPKEKNSKEPEAKDSGKKNAETEAKAK